MEIEEEYKRIHQDVAKQAADNGEFHPVDEHLPWD